MTDREQTRRTVNIICAKRPIRAGCVPAIHYGYREWRCSFCGARVKVVA